MGPVPFIALELLERGPPMLDDYRVPAHRLPDQLPAGTEAVAQLAELALLAIRLKKFNNSLSVRRFLSFRDGPRIRLT